MLDDVQNHSMHKTGYAQHQASASAKQAFLARKGESDTGFCSIFATTLNV